MIFPISDRGVTGNIKIRSLFLPEDAQDWKEKKRWGGKSVAASAKRRWMKHRKERKVGVCLFLSGLSHKGGENSHGLFSGPRIIFGGFSQRT